MTIALNETADRQAIWSQTADGLKRRLDWARWATFGLSILGAILATIASQLPAQPPEPRRYVAVAGAVCLALMGILISRMLSGTQIQSWVRARAASEALKREAYKRATGAAPYNDPATADSKLNGERDKIETDVEDLRPSPTAAGQGSTPRDVLARADYVERRLKGQRDWYRKKAAHYGSLGRQLRLVEFLLAIAAAAITAIVGAVEKTALHSSFDFVAVTAVLTTIGGAILAHIEQSRYDFLATTYLATDRRLGSHLASAGAVDALSADDWSAFVNGAEGILSEENTNWVAKWSKPES